MGHLGKGSPGGGESALQRDMGVAGLSIRLGRLSGQVGSDRVCGAWCAPGGGGVRLCGS